MILRMTTSRLMLNTEPDTTQVAVGVAVNSESCLLVGQRPAGKDFAGQWEFPGGKLEPGENWSQESIIGSVFDGSYEWIDESRILPTITGSAHLYSRGELIWQEGDPFGQGI